MRVKGRIRNATVLIALVMVLILSLFVAVTIGNAKITVQEVYRVLFYKLTGADAYQAYGSGAIHDVVWLIRLPRVLLAIGVGMGLSVCGCVMQAVVKNPLADPYVLGVSSGATLGATLAIMFGIGTLLGSNFIGIMAFVGALLSSFFVLVLANIRGRASTGSLILSGMAISSVCSAFSNFVLYIANDRNAMSQVTYWMMGSLAGAKWENVVVILPVIFLGAVIFWSQFRALNLMLLGEETAITLGTNLRKLRTWYLVLCSVMVGFSVYAAGMIGFVGLIVPHAVRMVVGTDHRMVIPVSALSGAIFLLWADVASKSILSYSEIPIGILVSMIGAPCFIFLMLKQSRGGRG